MKVFAEEKGFTEAPIFKVDGCSRVHRLLKDTCFSVLTISISLQHYFLQRVKKVAHLLFLPFLGMNDTDVMAHSWLHWIRHEGKGKEVRKVKREKWQYCHLQAQKHCPVVSTWEYLATSLGERTGKGRWVDRNRCWACIQRMKEAVQDFYFLRPYLHPDTSCLTSIYIAQKPCGKERDMSSEASDIKMYLNK